MVKVTFSFVFVSETHSISVCQAVTEQQLLFALQTSAAAWKMSVADDFWFSTDPLMNPAKGSSICCLFLLHFCMSAPTWTEKWTVCQALWLFLHFFWSPLQPWPLEFAWWAAAFLRDLLVLTSLLHKQVQEMRHVKVSFFQLSLFLSFSRPLMPNNLPFVHSINFLASTICSLHLPHSPVLQVRSIFISVCVWERNTWMSLWNWCLF